MRHYDRRVYMAACGKLLEQLRNHRRISQEHVAAYTQISQSSISRFENGQTMPDLHEACELAHALRTTVPKLATAIDRIIARATIIARKTNPKRPLEGLGAVELDAMVTLAVADGGADLLRACART